MSVIVPALNAATTIGEQLAALSKQTYRGLYEVVVVANCCTDDTAMVAESFSDQIYRLRVVRADERASSTYARNRGIAESIGRILLFCDADDVVSPAWIEEMTRALDTADVVGGHLVPIATAPPWAVRVLKNVLVDGLPRLSPEVRYVVGASLGCHRKVADTIGGWDERFGAASDDAAFSLAAQRAGFRLGYAHGAICSYRVRNSFKAVVGQQRRFGRGQADAIRWLRPHAYGGCAAELTVNSLWAARSLLRLRSTDDLRVLFAQAAFRLENLRGLRAWRRAGCPPSPLPPTRNVDYMVTLLAKRLAPVRRLNRVRLAAERMAWNQPHVDFTFALDTPVLGGLGAVAPPIVGHLYSNNAEIVEPVTLGLVSRLLVPNGAFLDVGANVGLYSMLALRAAPGGLVIAIEANPATTEALRANLSRHSSPGHSVVIRQVAAGARSGQLDLITSPNSLVDGVASSLYDARAKRTTTVNLIAIDDLNLPSLDVIKIDVEGYEPEVLDGMAETLARSPDACLVIELNPACLIAAQHQVDDLLRHDALRGRCFWVIDDSASGPAAIRPLQDALEAIESLGQTDLWFRNLLVAPESRAAAVESAIRGHFEQKGVEG